MDLTTSAYAFQQVGDGVVAWEDTGFADPRKRLLAALSEGGAVSAVATGNIEAMTRFGYARDGGDRFRRLRVRVRRQPRRDPRRGARPLQARVVDPESPMAASTNPTVARRRRHRRSRRP